MSLYQHTHCHGFSVSYTGIDAQVRMIPNLIGWWDAQDAVYEEEEGEDDYPIDSVHGKRGTPPLVSTGDNRPRIEPTGWNGTLPAIKFEDNEPCKWFKCNELASYFSINDAPYSLVAAYEPTHASKIRMLFAYQASNYHLLAGANNNSPYQLWAQRYDGAGSIAYATGTRAYADKKSILAWRVGGQTLKGDAKFSNTTLSGSGDFSVDKPAITPTTVYFCHGIDSSQLYTYGRLAELLVFSRSITDAELLAINTYLVAKWGPLETSG